MAEFLIAYETGVYAPDENGEFKSRVFVYDNGSELMDREMSEGGVMRWIDTKYRHHVFTVGRMCIWSTRPPPKPGRVGVSMPFPRDKDLAGWKQLCATLHAWLMAGAAPLGMKNRSQQFIEMAAAQSSVKPPRRSANPIRSMATDLNSKLERILRDHVDPLDGLQVHADLGVRDVRDAGVGPL